jgi:hypothetical protein
VGCGWLEKRECNEEKTFSETCETQTEVVSDNKLMPSTAPAAVAATVVPITPPSKVSMDSSHTVTPRSCMSEAGVQFVLLYETREVHRDQLAGTAEIRQVSHERGSNVDTLQDQLHTFVTTTHFWKAKRRKFVFYL